MGIFKDTVDSEESNAQIKTQVETFLGLKREMERLFQQALSVRENIATVKGTLIGLGADETDLAEITSLEQAWVSMVNTTLDGISE